MSISQNPSTNVGQTPKTISSIIITRSHRNRQPSQSVLGTKYMEGLVIWNLVEATSVFPFSMISQSTYTMMGKEVESHSASIVDGADYIGYTAKFTEAVDLATMVKDMDSLNMGPVRTNPRQKRSPFAPYSASARPSKRSNAFTTTAVESAPTKRSKSSDDLKPWGEPSWGKLISKTEGFADISLVLNSTGLGNQMDFVDFRTGERENSYSEPLFSCVC
jgi:hypothetical protein